MSRTLREKLLGKWTWGRALRSVLFVYVALGVYGFFFSEGLLFRPSASSYQDGPNIIKLTTRDGVQISALYLPNPQATYTLLYSHGNGEDLGDMRPILERLRASGFAVFAYDYEGYGTSQGQPSEQKAYRDIDAAYQYLRTNLKLPPQRIIGFGRSVGGGPTVDLATRQPIAGLILESTFTSVFRVIIPVPLYPFDKFNNLHKISAVRCPILVIHGTHDQTIPFQQGQALFQRAHQPKQFLAVAAADHNDVMDVAGKHYTQALQAFTKLIQAAATSEVTKTI